MEKEPELSKIEKNILKNETSLFSGTSTDKLQEARDLLSEMAKEFINKSDLKK